MVWWKKKGKKEPEEPFPDLFSEMRRMMDEMSKGFEEEMNLEDFFKEFKNIKPGKPMVYGFSLKIGPDGKPRFEQFGNVEPAQKTIKEEREPLVDVINKEKEITVLAELPGVEKQEIKLDVIDGNDVLLINVPNKFNKRLKLPAKVKPKLAKAHYKNGVLEVNLEKEKPGKIEKGGIPVE